jgi:hypothetical protein
MPCPDYLYTVTMEIIQEETDGGRLPEFHLASIGAFCYFKNGGLFWNPQPAGKSLFRGIIEL